MKKITKFLIVLVLVLGIFGCAKKTNKATEVYQKTIETMKDITAGDVTIDMNISMSFLGQSQEIRILMSMELEDANETDYMKIRGKGNMSMTAYGENIDMEYYMLDGNMYMIANGVKMYGSFEEIASSSGQSLNSLTQTQQITAYDVDFIKDAKFTELSDGNYEYVLDVSDPEMISKLLGQLSSENLSALGDNLENIDKLIYTIIIDKDYHFSEMIIEASMNLSVEGFTIPANYLIKMKYNNIGKPVVIDFPDFSDYQNVSSSN